MKDKKPKFFRSPTEGNMIIYLSNISFTPNKILGREIYDFSATATEVCEATYENLIKYNLIFNHITIRKDTILRAIKTETEEQDGVIYLIPYISSSDIIVNNDGSYSLKLYTENITEVNYA